MAGFWVLLLLIPALLPDPVCARLRGERQERVGSATEPVAVLVDAGSASASEAPDVTPPVWFPPVGQVPFVKKRSQVEPRILFFWQVFDVFTCCFAGDFCEWSILMTSQWGKSLGPSGNLRFLSYPSQVPPDFVLQ